MMSGGKVDQAITFSPALIKLNRQSVCILFKEGGGMDNMNVGMTG